MRRIARATRERAGAVMTHRGRVVRHRRAGSTDVTWWQVNQFGQASFRINRNHPLIVDLLTRHPEMRPGLTALLGLVESTLPVELIRMVPDAGPATTTDSGTAPDEVVEMAGEVLEALVSQGSSGSEALFRVLGIGSRPALVQLVGQLVLRHEVAILRRSNPRRPGRPARNRPRGATPPLVDSVVQPATLKPPTTAGKDPSVIGLSIAGQDQVDETVATRP